MKVGIVELSSSHSECIYTQLLDFKKAGKTVYFIGNQIVWERIPYQEEFADCFLIPEKSNLKQLIRLKKYFKEQKIKEIRLNTASGKSIRNFLLLACTKYQTVSGILHNVEKLKKSSTQKMISKSVTQYFVLAEYLKEKSKQYSNKVPVSVLQITEQANSKIETLKKPTEEIWICVPGQVEHKRRDYTTLIQQVKQEGLDAKVKFILLGKGFHQHGDGLEILKELQEIGVEDQFMFWPEFVSESEFEQYMNASDFLLPLIHSAHPSFQQYQTQISGTFHLALAHEKPILVSEQVWEIQELQHLRVNYSEEQLIQFINALPKRV